jgi:hypothetical protein
MVCDFRGLARAGGGHRRDLAAASQRQQSKPVAVARERRLPGIESLAPTHRPPAARPVRLRHCPRCRGVGRETGSGRFGCVTAISTPECTRTMICCEIALLHPYRATCDNSQAATPKHPLGRLRGFSVYVPQSESAIHVDRIAVVHIGLVTISKRTDVNCRRVPRQMPSS